MLLIILVWIGVSALVTLAFVFGSGVGFRRGLAQAQAVARYRDPSDAHREVRLPEDLHSGY